MTDAAHTSGKRKTAKARASVKEGEGTIRVNSRPIQTMEKLSRQRIKEPLTIDRKSVV